MKRRSFILGGSGLLALPASSAIAETSEVTVSGFLVFRKEVGLPKGTKLLVSILDLYSQHGHSWGHESSPISDTRHPWGFSIKTDLVPALLPLSIGGWTKDDTLLFGAFTVAELKHTTTQHIRVVMTEKIPARI